MGDLTDFDAFDAEQEGRGPTVRVAGKEWTLPADVPARTIARIQRLRVELGGQLSGLSDDDDVPAHLLEGLAELESPVAILRSLVGDDLVDGMLDAGMGSRAARRLAAVALHYYETGLWDPTVGNPQAPNGAPRKPADRKPKTGKHSGGKTSSSTGKRSKATSSASTA